MLLIDKATEYFEKSIRKTENEKILLDTNCRQ